MCRNKNFFFFKNSKVFFGTKGFGEEGTNIFTGIFFYFFGDELEPGNYEIMQIIEKIKELVIKNSVYDKIMKAKL